MTTDTLFERIFALEVIYALESAGPGHEGSSTRPCGPVRELARRAQLPALPEGVRTASTRRRRRRAGPTAPRAQGVDFPVANVPGCRHGRTHAEGLRIFRHHLWSRRRYPGTG